ncbi:NADPH-dependent FMN reductase [Nocardia sp. NPDC059239]|uniref:NADPH-dependent FMN reductase n=1 Tax=unclassified Nocardia TaxID=2637762 RepID=UPI0036C5ED89
MKIVSVYGTAARPGRLWSVLESFAAALPDASSHTTVDLHHKPVDWADGRPIGSLSKDTGEAVDLLAASDAVVLFAPVYRAAMPGVLKNLLDLTPLDALEGKVLGLVAMGASPHHYLAIDYEIRRLAAWFGAIVPATTVYLTGSSFVDGALGEQATGDVRSHARSVWELAGRLTDHPVEPRPLAAVAK